MSDLISNAEDLGEGDDFEILDRLVPVGGLDVVDVGCGDGRIARLLAERGAKTIGVEPDPIQAEINRNATPVSGLSFIQAPGQSLPVADASKDGVFFSYSLHHVPKEYMDEALAEATRVLKPETGFLYALEPMMEGSLEDLYRPFHDEVEVRTFAYEALRRSAAPRFKEGREYRYREDVRYDSFAAFVDEVAGKTYSDFTREQVDTPQVKALFEAGKSGDGYVFTQHARVNLYRGPHLHTKEH